MQFMSEHQFLLGFVAGILAYPVAALLLWVLGGSVSISVERVED
jgi:hypothetical protein